MSNEKEERVDELLVRIKALSAGVESVYSVEEGYTEDIGVLRIMRTELIEELKDLVGKSKALLLTYVLGDLE